MTDSEKEQALEQQDKIELQKFRQAIRNPREADAIEFRGAMKEMGNLQVFEEIGRQGIAFNTYGFISDEAVELAKSHLAQFQPQDEEEDDA